MAFDITDRRESEQDLATAYATLRAVEASRRDLLVRLLRARELEASRLAADLHDGPVQRFMAVGLRLASLRGMVEDPAAREVIANLETHVGGGSTPALADDRARAAGARDGRPLRRRGFSSCTGAMIAPMSTALSSGSPTRRVSIRALSLADQPLGHPLLYQDP